MPSFLYVAVFGHSASYTSQNLISCIHGKILIVSYQYVLHMGHKTFVQTATFLNADIVWASLLLRFVIYGLFRSARAHQEG